MKNKAASATNLSLTLTYLRAPTCSNTKRIFKATKKSQRNILTEKNDFFAKKISNELRFFRLVVDEENVVVVVV